MVETVSREPLRAGIKVKFRATFFFRARFHPPHERFGMTGSTMALESNEIIDIERPSPSKPFRNAERSSGNRPPVIFDVDQSPS